MAALVGYARDGRRLDPPPEAIDAHLLKAFPGRTLEELDGLDWGRWQRALEAQMHLDVEQLRRRFHNAEIKSADIPPDVWALILEHDALVGDEDDGQE